MWYASPSLFALRNLPSPSPAPFSIIWAESINTRLSNIWLSSYSRQKDAPTGGFCLEGQEHPEFSFLPLCTRWLLLQCLIFLVPVPVILAYYGPKSS